MKVEMPNGSLVDEDLVRLKVLVNTLGLRRLTESEETDAGVVTEHIFDLRTTALQLEKDIDWLKDGIRKTIILMQCRNIDIDEAAKRLQIILDTLGNNIGETEETIGG